MSEKSNADTAPRGSTATHRKLTGHSGMVFASKFSPDGSMLATCSLDKTVKLWDSRTDQLLRTLSGHSSSVTNCTFSLDGKHFVTASRDMTLILCDAITWQQKFVPPEVQELLSQCKKK
ncbi:MAG: hypothetical protein GYA24_17115 [Candidatus Lokiarchaeota archaeon]|nr:hypothetical protein [Candidatus Lokiarchaeota archaeon]